MGAATPALFLLPFIFAFGKKQIIKPNTFSRGTALIAAIVTAITLADVTGSASLAGSARTWAPLFASVVCHRGLAERRPHVAADGVLSPHVDRRRARRRVQRSPRASALQRPLRVSDRDAMVPRACIAHARKAGSSGKPILKIRGPRHRDGPGGRARHVRPGEVGAARHQWTGRAASAGCSGVPLVFAFVWSTRPVRYAVAIGGSPPRRHEPWLRPRHHGLGGSGLLRGPSGHARQRIAITPRVGQHHARQASARSEGALVPLAYHHPSGPAGDVLGPLPGVSKLELGPRRVGVIGSRHRLVAAAYARGPPTTGRSSRSTRHRRACVRRFTYVKRAGVGRGPHRARRCSPRLHEEAQARFDILVLDAFSSDAVPTHLMTREANACTAARSGPAAYCSPISPTITWCWHPSSQRRSRRTRACSPSTAATTISPASKRTRARRDPSGWS